MASTGNTWQPVEAWRRFRLEAEAARNYHLSYSLYIGQTHRDVLLEQLLPTLLHVKAVALLDDALALWLDANGHHLSRPYRDDLNGRLEYLKDRNLLGDVDHLHAVRRRRNGFAHEPGTHCEWTTLAQDLSTIETGLVQLALARNTPKLEYFCERSQIQESNEPGISFCRTFSYGVREGDQKALEISFTQKIHKAADS